VPRIKVPTLVVGAEDDRIVPNLHVDRWAELVPGARLERVPGTGHGLLMQEPDRVAELIHAFIEGVNR
jgi:pimeloyl-ACP methyl ester carboxylesterase